MEIAVVKKNDIIPLEITGMSQDGNGIGRHGDMVIFVRMSAPGDKLLARIVKVMPRMAYGIIEEMLESSDGREENKCPVYNRCGGCELRHLQYERELAVKEGWARENLRRIGGVDVEFEPMIASPKTERYRNKAQYAVRKTDNGLKAGFFARRSHDLIAVDDCLLQPAIFAEIANDILQYMTTNGVEAYDEVTHSGLVRNIYLRLAEATGEIMVCLVINGGRIPNEAALIKTLSAKGISTIVLSINRKKGNGILGDKEKVIYGKGHIEDILCGVRLRLSARSFYQVNREAAQALYEKALEFAEVGSEDVLVDMYCGTGAIGLSMAGHVKEVIGVEAVESAILDARQNAVRNNISNASFILSDAAVALTNGNIKADIVVLDPPRKGAGKEVLEQIAAMKPKKIVYISCDSATLARDCAILAGLGYHVTRAVAADLFPRTPHTEIALKLEAILGNG